MLALEVTHYHFTILTWLHKSALLHMEGDHEGQEYQEARVAGGHLEAGYHSYLLAQAQPTRLGLPND